MRKLCCNILMGLQYERPKLKGQRSESRPVGSNYRLGGHNYRLGGAHIIFFKMTDLCNEQYSIFVQIIGGHGPPCPPYSYGPAVNLDLWNLFIAIVSLDKTYQVRIMTKASTVFKKSTFQKFSHLNSLGSKFNLDVK